MLPYPIGIIHSYKKHSQIDFACSILIPPWGFYRGIEILWHSNEEENLKWEKEMQYQIKIFAFICNKTFNGETDLSDIVETENLRVRFNKFPEEFKLEFAKRCRLYIDYTLSLQSELLTKVSNETPFEKFEKSSEILEKEKLLIQYGLKNEIEINNQAINNVIEKQIKEINSRDELTEEELNEINVIMRNFLSDSEKRIKILYKEVLGFELYL